MTDLFSIAEAWVSRYVWPEGVTVRCGRHAVPGLMVLEMRHPGAQPTWYNLSIPETRNEQFDRAILLVGVKRAVRYLHGLLVKRLSDPDRHPLPQTPQYRFDFEEE